jgi:hypothetical protein
LTQQKRGVFAALFLFQTEANYADSAHPGMRPRHRRDERTMPAAKLLLADAVKINDKFPFRAFASPELDESIGPKSGYRFSDCLDAPSKC